VRAALGPPAANLRRRAGRVRRLPRRVGRALRAIDDVDLRSAQAAEALGRLEAQVRDAEQRQLRAVDELARVAALISQGHATAGRAKEEFWHVVQEIASRLAAYEGNVHSRTEWIDARLTDVQSEIQISGERIDILQRKLAAMAVDLRDRLPAVPAPQDLPEPVIPDPSAYEARLAAIGDDIRVNLGAGEKPLDEYVNVDMRPLEGIDVVADVRRLPFEPGSLAEIASFHLVEHFRENELRLTVLPYWRSLLREDGVLRIVCPNWEAMAARLADGRMPWAEFRLLTFGLQDYEGDDHFAMYTPDSLGQVLTDAGFADVRVVEDERMNGLCPEMELVAQSAVTVPSTGEAHEAD
jgi:predicted SAM-dependent methyltransferase